MSITSTHILYAKWSGDPNTPYTIKHYQENIDGFRYINIFGKKIPVGIAITLKEAENRTHTAGEEITPEVKTYAGFTSPNKKTVTIGGDGKTVVEYYYTRNKYKLTFKPENGDEDIVMTVKYGAPITVPEVTREGYTFDSWTQELETTMPAEDLTYTAKWIDNLSVPYTVKHYKERLGSDEYDLFEAEDLTGDINNPITPDVKTYVGFTAPVTKTVTITLDGKTTVNYYYTRNNYNLTIKPENGDKAMEMTVEYGAPITMPEVTKIGYTFAGWTPEPETSMPAEDTAYTAKWTANTYTVTFDSNGGSDSGSSVVTFGSLYGALPTPTLDGYIFAGWYTSETNDNGSGTKITSSTTVSTAENHVLYAKWDEPPTEPEIVVYNLSLNDGKIVIYPDRFIHNGVTTAHDSKASKFIISGECTDDTPLHIFNDTNSPVTYNITLKNAVVTCNDWSTAVRIDYDGEETETQDRGNLVVNFAIDGVVRFSGHTHSGLQANGKVNVNLTGTANSTFICEDRYRYNETWQAVGSNIMLNIQEDNIAEMKVSGVVTSNITDVYGSYSSPVQITFK